MKIEHDQQRILKILMHNPLKTFNQLWDKEGRSNKFAYHLRVLEDRGLVEKTEAGPYQLTAKGKQHVTYLEGETGKKVKFPVLAVIPIVYDEKTKKFLMIHRKKEPFHGYLGFPGGKLNFSQYIFECAKEKLLQETGLECDFEFKGIFSSKTFENDTLAYNHQLFIIKATNPKGKLIPETREGKNIWLTREEALQQKILPNIPHLIDVIQCEGFKWVEADRLKKDGTFTDMNVLRDITL